MLAGLRTTERSEVYLTIAAAALVKGKVDLARFAAAQALPLAPEESAERERARLYEGAALIVTPDFDKGVEALSAVDRSKLGAEEIALLEASLSIAGQVRRLPAAPEAEATPPTGMEATSTGIVLERARKTIARVDGILDEAGK
jgi:chemotaxis protein MotC